MSWQAVTWVLEHSEATLGSRLVLLSIASHANREGKSAWPSVDTICLEAKLSRREVQYALRSLEASGELRTKQIRGQSSHYELTQVEAWIGAQSLRPANSAPAQSTTRGAQPSAQGGAQSSAPEPSLNRQLNQPKVSEATLAIRKKRQEAENKSWLRRYPRQSLAG